MVAGRPQGAIRVGEGESLLMIQPGEVYLASTDAGNRPVVVVSREELNRGNWVVAVLVTSARYPLRLDTSSLCPVSGRGIRAREGLRGSSRDNFLYRHRRS